MANYCTIDQVKAALVDSGFASTDTTYDTILTMLVASPSRDIDALTKRPDNYWYASAETTRYYTGSGNAWLWLPDYPYASITSVAISESGGVQSSDYTTVPSSDYFTWPMNETPYKRLDMDVLNGAYSYWPKYPKAVRIIGYPGYSTDVPDLIEQAAIIQASRWFKRGKQGYQDTGAIPELAQFTYTKKIDPDIETIVFSMPGARRVTV